MATIAGLLAMFFNPFFEKLSFFNVNKIKYKNFLMFLFFLNSMIGLFLLHIIVGYEIHFDFLKDPIFFLLLLLELSMINLVKKNYYIQYKNFSNVSFAMFSTVYLMPVVSYLYFKFLPLPINENIVKLFYNSIYEVIIISLIFFILNLWYFYDKVKLKVINKPWLLCLQAFVAINTMFFGIFTIQRYDGFMPYIFVFLFLCVFYLSFSFFYEYNYIIKNKNEVFSLKTFIISQSWIGAVFFYQIGAKFIPVEFVAFLKRLGQLVNGYFFDRYMSKNMSISKKDITVIFLTSFMIFAVFIYYNFLN